MIYSHNKKRTAQGQRPGKDNTMKENTYFENLAKTCEAYEAAKEERMKERTAMMKADDWDAVRAFDEREDREYPKPYTRGQSYAFRAYRENLYNNSEGFFEVRDLPLEQDTPDFLDTLRKAGITVILVTDESTALMEALFILTDLGCRMAGLKTYTRIERRWGADEELEIRGIEMEIA